MDKYVAAGGCALKFIRVHILFGSFGRLSRRESAIYTLKTTHTRSGGCGVTGETIRGEGGGRMEFVIYYSGTVV